MGKKILIIEDEPALVKAFEVRLRTEGYEPVAAFDGEEGLRKAREEAPDLIILDLMLPRIEGYEICRRLKSDENCEHIPIMMVTVKSQDEDRAKGFRMGADEYVVKPFEWDNLLGKVNSLVGPKATILVTDDEPDLVKALTLRLESEGYKVVTASDGKESLQKARELEPDLIILDVMMPEMDGFEACRCLRKDLGLDIPIIMLTVKAESDDKTKGLQMGADVYITKPFDYDNLIYHVRTLLEARLLN